MRALAAVALVLLTAPTGVLRGQEADPVDPREESALLREASGLEWRGRLDEAVATLEGLLRRHPTSSGGLFALERVLRSMGRVGEVLPWADRFLEARPDASGPRFMKLRVLVEVDSLEALEPAAEAWFRAEPGSPDPYREVARLYRRAFGEERALETLRRGRGVLDEPSALSLDLGDLLLAMGDGQGAAEAWAEALRRPEADVDGVIRRLDGAQGDRARLAEPLLEALLDEPTTPERRRAAVRVALEVGVPDRAREVADDALRGLSRAQRRAFLEGVSREAEDRGVPRVTLWALERLGEESDGLGAAQTARMAAAALAAGDTATALEAQTRLARALPPGSDERRRVVADLIRVEARVADAATLEQRLEGFRREFPDATETDDLAAAVAAGLAARGQEGQALQVAGRVQGPRSQLERAWLLFGRGETEEGRVALEAALPVLAPSRATEVIQLLASMDRVGPEAGAALARAAAESHHGRGAEAAAGLEEALPDVPEEDRSPLLSRAGQLRLALGDTAGAEGHLRALVEGHADSAEAPEAMFALARIRAAAPGGLDEARALLERLILERPQAAVVPVARRELQRLGRGG